MRLLGVTRDRTAPPALLPFRMTSIPALAISLPTLLPGR
jgi:hypothetical protein